MHETLIETSHQFEGESGERSDGGIWRGTQGTNPEHLANARGRSEYTRTRCKIQHFSTKDARTETLGTRTDLDAQPIRSETNGEILVKKGTNVEI